jgi:anhydro-N-acetylmuramic acid kinase
VLGHAYMPFDVALRGEFLALNRPGDNEIHRSHLAANRLAQVYAEVVEELLKASGLARRQVRAIGAHGQTVRHRPLEFDGVGYTTQIQNAALLAELSGIPVVADFRSRDLAAGGQGAPSPVRTGRPSGGGVESGGHWQPQPHQPTQRGAGL